MIDSGTFQLYEYRLPTRQSLPSPKDEKRPLFKLADLPSRHYVNTVARVCSFKVKEKVDELGPKKVYSGILQDHTFKTPYLCHKLSLPFETNTVLSIYSAYVYEFHDKSQIIILTEYSGERQLRDVNLFDYIWTPRIEEIRKPVWDVTLEGTVTSVYPSSGLVKRCRNCNSIMYDKCLNGCGEKWDWHLRLSLQLSDDSGSIKTVIGEYWTTQLIDRKLGEILIYAYSKNRADPNDLDVLSFKLSMPDSLDVVEALVENPSYHRRWDSLIVSDHKNRINHLPNEHVMMF